MYKTEHINFVLTGLTGFAIILLGVYLGVFTPRAILVLPLAGFVIFYIAMKARSSSPSYFDYYGRMFFHSAGGIFVVVFGFLFTREALILTLLALLLICLTNLLLERRGIKTTFSQLACEVRNKTSLKPSFYLSGTLGILSFLIVFILFDVRVAFASTLALALGDSGAALAGRFFGRTRNPLNKNKSLEGSIACFAMSFIGAILFVTPMVALVGAVVGTIVEMLPLAVNDNLTIPISVASIMHITLSA